MSSKIDDLFRRLRSQQQKAFMPFITAGDPDLKFTEDLLVALDKTGCHLIELGIPYSDPIADGPVIQESYSRALTGGVRLDDILDMLGRTTSRLQAPVVMMVSYAIIFRHGIDSFIQRTTAVGVAGVIVPDLPADESLEFLEQCRQYQLDLIQLVTPTTSPHRRQQILDRSSGFVYYVSVAGITGERQALPKELLANLETIRRETDLPICLGFGISSPEQVTALRAAADGFIVGSAIVRRIAAASAPVSPASVIAATTATSATIQSADNQSISTVDNNQSEQAIADICEFCDSMLRAL